MSAAGPKTVKDLREENSRLKEQIEDFEKLHQVMESIGSSLEVSEVIEHIIEETIQLCQADQGSVILIDPAGLNEARTLIRQGEASEIKLDHFLNMMLTGWVSTNGRPLCTDKPAEIVGESFVKDKYLEIGSLMSIPLYQAGEMIGALNLLRLKDRPPLAERELNLLNILATTFAQYIHNARLHSQIFKEAERLRKEVQDRYAFHGIIGQSQELQKVFKLLERVIPTDVRVLIEGESGTGKELIARVIHYSGPRKDAPFVAIDCGALPANLLEGELFGYKKGAFTGAHKDKKGLFEVANGGTLFLDEIANMPLEIQSKFLRTLQEGEIRPLGSTEVKNVDVRVIAAGSGGIKNRVEEGTFRQDLFYRLNVVSIQLPPLRDRKGDIAILANHFLEKLNKRHQHQHSGFKPETMATMEAYDWPGNVRELENIVERMVILAESDSEFIGPDLLPMEIRPRQLDEKTIEEGDGAAHDIRYKKDTYEKMMLVEALAGNQWNQSAAARQLGISERTVRYKMKKFAIRKP